MVFLIIFCNFIACNCDTGGSQDTACDNNGRCTCKDGYAGEKCDVCAHGFYKKSNALQYICSGIIALVV